MRFLLATLLVSLVFAMPAQAHYTGKGVSEAIWYGRFNSWCGIGKPWCDVRKIQLFCNKFTDSRDGGHHYRFCIYEFREAKFDFFAPFGIDTRYCHMDGEMRHHTILYGMRNCTAWS